jgi:IS5 family transposase
MRKTFERQSRFGRQPIMGIVLNINCRDEIIPILAALQHIYSQPQVRDQILALVAGDVNQDSREDCGREGLDYWQVLVLAAVRLGCNLDYDRLQDLAEQHRTLRMLMGIGDWDDETNFSWRRIRDNVCLLKPATIAQISHLVVGAGHRLVPEAAETTRADSFVVETNVHYPTESSLIYDGLRKVLEVGSRLAKQHGVPGWRQHRHLLKRVKRTARRIARIASRKGANYEQRQQDAHRTLFELANTIIARARELGGKLSGAEGSARFLLSELTAFIERTEHVMNTARRRVMAGERVPNEEKLFSMFEPHTQLYKRGKARQPVQFGRLAMVYEDGAGFITHLYLLERDATDRDVVVEQTRIVQERLGGRIQRASFDRGFHSPQNQTALAQIIAHPCLPKPGPRQSVEQDANATVQFRAARQSHPGIESAIGALQSGNGLERCRDRSELGFERYLTLGVLGRNLHVLGRLVIAKRDALCEAAKSLRRQPSAA